MKTNKIIYTLALVLLSSLLMFTSCKKRKAFKNEDGQSSADNRNVQSENDNAINDANQVISDNALLHGRTPSTNSLSGVLGTICGMTVDTTGMYTGTVKLNYDGTTCSNRTRTGSIRITIQGYSTGVRWKNANAILQVDYLAYKVRRASDGKSVELNGTQYIKNKTGGTWFDLFFLGQTSLAHEVTGTNLNVKFEDGSTAVYNINRRFTYTLPNSILTCTGEGIGSSNGLSNLENYGTTRDGDAFTSQVTTPIVWNWTCGWWAPTQGAVNIVVASKYFDLKVQFAVDASGNPVAVAANSCAYGFKVEWTYKNKTKKKVYGYW